MTEQWTGLGDVDSISIHTSAREVTNPTGYQANPWNISIHTSAREVTLQNQSKGGDYIISIHTSAREVTAIFHKNISLFL